MWRRSLLFNAQYVSYTIQKRAVCQTVFIKSSNFISFSKRKTELLDNEICRMHIEIDVPEDVATALIAEGADISRTAIEGLALEGYRTGRLSEEQVRRLLGFGSRIQVHGFLKDHQVYLNYSEQDLEHDLETSRKFGPQWSLPTRRP